MRVHRLAFTLCALLAAPVALGGCPSGGASNTTSSTASSTAGPSKIPEKRDAPGLPAQPGKPSGATMGGGGG